MPLYAGERVVGCLCLFSPFSYQDRYNAEKVGVGEVSFWSGGAVIPVPNLLIRKVSSVAVKWLIAIEYFCLLELDFWGLPLIGEITSEDIWQSLYISLYCFFLSMYFHKTHFSGGVYLWLLYVSVRFWYVTKMVVSNTVVTLFLVCWPVTKNFSRQVALPH